MLAMEIGKKYVWLSGNKPTFKINYADKFFSPKCKLI